MVANGGNGNLVYEIRIPVLVAMAWAGLGMATSSIIPDSPVSNAVWLAVRIALVAAAGYLATCRDRFDLLHAALAGVIVMVGDHVLVKGVSFLVRGELMAAAGVLVSFVMFFWLAAMIGWIGGVVGKIAARGIRRSTGSLGGPS